MNCMGMVSLRCVLVVVVCARASGGATGPQTTERDPITIRVHGAPDTASPDGAQQARIASITQFQHEHPWIQLTPNTGLEIEGRGGTMVTLMQIAGDIAPDVLHM